MGTRADEVGPMQDPGVLEDNRHGEQWDRRYFALRRVAERLQERLGDKSDTTAHQQREIEVLRRLVIDKEIEIMQLRENSAGPASPGEPPQFITADADGVSVTLTSPSSLPTRPASTRRLYTSSTVRRPTASSLRRSTSLHAHGQPSTRHKSAGGTNTRTQRSGSSRGPTTHPNPSTQRPAQHSASKAHSAGGGQVESGQRQATAYGLPTAPAKVATARTAQTTTAYDPPPPPLLKLPSRIKRKAKSKGPASGQLPVNSSSGGSGAGHQAPSNDPATSAGPAPTEMVSAALQLLAGYSHGPSPTSTVHPSPKVTSSFLPLPPSLATPPTPSTTKSKPGIARRLKSLFSFKKATPDAAVVSAQEGVGPLQSAMAVQRLASTPGSHAQSAGGAARAAAGPQLAATAMVTPATGLAPAEETLGPLSRHRQRLHRQQAAASGAWDGDVAAGGSEQSLHSTVPHGVHGGRRPPASDLAAVYVPQAAPQIQRWRDLHRLLFREDLVEGKVDLQPHIVLPAQLQNPRAPRSAFPVPSPLKAVGAQQPTGADRVAPQHSERGVGVACQSDGVAAPPERMLDSQTLLDVARAVVASDPASPPPHQMTQNQGAGEQRSGTAASPSPSKHLDAVLSQLRSFKPAPATGHSPQQAVWGSPEGVQQLPAGGVCPVEAGVGSPEHGSGSDLLQEASLLHMGRAGVSPTVTVTTDTTGREAAAGGCRRDTPLCSKPAGGSQTRTAAEPEERVGRQGVVSEQWARAIEQYASAYEVQEASGGDSASSAGDQQVLGRDSLVVYEATMDPRAADLAGPAVLAMLAQARAAGEVSVEAQLSPSEAAAGEPSVESSGSMVSASFSHRASSSQAGAESEMLSAECSVQAQTEHSVVESESSVPPGAHGSSPMPVQDDAGDRLPGGTESPVQAVSPSPDPHQRSVAQQGVEAAVTRQQAAETSGQAGALGTEESSCSSTSSYLVSLPPPPPDSVVRQSLTRSMTGVSGTLHAGSPAATNAVQAAAEIMPSPTAAEAATPGGDMAGSVKPLGDVADAAECQPEQEIRRESSQGVSQMLSPDVGRPAQGQEEAADSSAVDSSWYQTPADSTARTVGCMEPRTTHSGSSSESMPDDDACVIGSKTSLRWAVSRLAAAQGFDTSSLSRLLSGASPRGGGPGADLVAGAASDDVDAAQLQQQDLTEVPDVDAELSEPEQPLHVDSSTVAYADECGAHSAHESTRSSASGVSPDKAGGSGACGRTHVPVVAEPDVLTSGEVWGSQDSSAAQSAAVSSVSESLDVELSVTDLASHQALRELPPPAAATEQRAELPCLPPAQTQPPVDAVGAMCVVSSEADSLSEDLVCSAAQPSAATAAATATQQVCVPASTASGILCTHTAQEHLSEGAGAGEPLSGADDVAGFSSMRSALAVQLPSSILSSDDQSDTPESEPCSDSPATTAAMVTHMAAASTVPPLCSGETPGAELGEEATTGSEDSTQLAEALCTAAPAAEPDPQPPAESSSPTQADAAAQAASHAALTPARKGSRISRSQPQSAAASSYAGRLASRKATMAVSTATPLRSVRLSHAGSRSLRVATSLRVSKPSPTPMPTVSNIATPLSPGSPTCSSYGDDRTPRKKAVRLLDNAVWDMDASPNDRGLGSARSTPLGSPGPYHSVAPALQLGSAQSCDVRPAQPSSPQTAPARLAMRRLAMDDDMPVGPGLVFEHEAAAEAVLAEDSMAVEENSVGGEASALADDRAAEPGLAYGRLVMLTPGSGSSDSSPSTEATEGPSGQDLTEDTPIPSGQGLAEDTPIPSGQDLAEDTPIPSGQDLTEDTPIPSGQGLAEDTPIPSGQDLAEDTPIPSGQGMAEDTSNAASPPGSPAATPAPPPAQSLGQDGLERGQRHGESTPRANATPPAPTPDPVSAVASDFASAFASIRTAATATVASFFSLSTFSLAPTPTPAPASHPHKSSFSVATPESRVVVQAAEPTEAAPVEAATSSPQPPATQPQPVASPASFFSVPGVSQAMTTAAAADSASSSSAAAVVPEATPAAAAADATGSRTPSSAVKAGAEQVAATGQEASQGGSAGGPCVAAEEQPGAACSTPADPHPEVVEAEGASEEEAVLPDTLDNAVSSGWAVLQPVIGTADPEQPSSPGREPREASPIISTPCSAKGATSPPRATTVVPEQVVQGALEATARGTCLPSSQQQQAVEGVASEVQQAAAEGATEGQEATAEGATEGQEAERGPMSPSSGSLSESLPQFLVLRSDVCDVRSEDLGGETDDEDLGDQEEEDLGPASCSVTPEPPPVTLVTGQPTAPAACEVLQASAATAVAGPESGVASPAHSPGAGSTRAVPGVLYIPAHHQDHHTPGSAVASPGVEQATGLSPSAAHRSTEQCSPARSPDPLLAVHMPESLSPGSEVVIGSPPQSPVVAACLVSPTSITTMPPGAPRPELVPGEIANTTAPAAACDLSESQDAGQQGLANDVCEEPPEGYGDSQSAAVPSEQCTTPTARHLGIDPLPAMEAQSTTHAPNSQMSIVVVAAGSNPGSPATAHTPAWTGRALGLHVTIDSPAGDGQSEPKAPTPGSKVLTPVSKVTTPGSKGLHGASPTGLQGTQDVTPGVLQGGAAPPHGDAAVLVRRGTEEQMLAGMVGTTNVDDAAIAGTQGAGETAVSVAVAHIPATEPKEVAVAEAATAGGVASAVEDRRAVTISSVGGYSDDGSSGSQVTPGFNTHSHPGASLEQLQAEEGAPEWSEVEGQCSSTTGSRPRTTSAGTSLCASQQQLAMLAAVARPHKRTADGLGLCEEEVDSVMSRARRPRRRPAATAVSEQAVSSPASGAPVQGSVVDVSALLAMEHKYMAQHILNDLDLRESLPVNPKLGSLLGSTEDPALLPAAATATQVHSPKAALPGHPPVPTTTLVIPALHSPAASSSSAPQGSSSPSHQAWGQQAAAGGDVSTERLAAGDMFTQGVFGSQAVATTHPRSQRRPAALSKQNSRTRSAGSRATRPLDSQAAPGLALDTRPITMDTAVGAACSPTAGGGGPHFQPGAGRLWGTSAAAPTSPSSAGAVMMFSSTAAPRMSKIQPAGSSFSIPMQFGGGFGAGALPQPVRAVDTSAAAARFMGITRTAPPVTGITAAPATSVFSVLGDGQQGADAAGVRGALSLGPLGAARARHSLPVVASAAVDPLPTAATAAAALPSSPAARAPGFSALQDGGYIYGSRVVGGGGTSPAACVGAAQACDGEHSGRLAQHVLACGGMAECSSDPEGALRDSSRDRTGSADGWASARSDMTPSDDEHSRQLPVTLV